MLRRLLVSLVVFLVVGAIGSYGLMRNALATPICYFDSVDEVSVIGQTGHIHIGTLDNVNAWVGTYLIDLDFETAYDVYDGRYEGYCIEDIYSPDNEGGYALYDAEGSSANYEAAAYLFNQYASSVSSNAERAGLQLAIWEAVFDYGSYNLTQGNGNFYVYNGYLSSAITYANTYLNSLNLFNPDTFNASGYGLVSDDNPLSLDPQCYQDYIIANPIPEPSTMILLSSLAIGLFGVFGIRKRLLRG
ncbi:MAG TPA: PEP-CTERM sorting domain-containing protein [Candidatus Omnitrophica bacterium]|nr:PEP-CTERM sorting domain-containing protein [Candidatus Omnitrophota bacterium]